MNYITDETGPNNLNLTFGGIPCIRAPPLTAPCKRDSGHHVNVGHRQGRTRDTPRLSQLTGHAAECHRAAAGIVWCSQLSSSEGPANMTQATDISTALNGLRVQHPQDSGSGLLEGKVAIVTGKEQTKHLGPPCEDRFVIKTSSRTQAGQGSHFEVTLV